MKISSKAISILVLSVLGASIACAQGGGGQRAGGQGQGGFGQRGGGMNYELSLLNRSDVQTDLGLTSDQKTKVEDYITKNRPQRPGGGGGAGGAGGGGGQRGGGNGGGGGGFGGGAGGGQLSADQIAAMQKAQAERREKTRKELLEIISEAQLKRVDEINLQLQGFNALTMPQIQEALGFTTDQKSKIADLQGKQREANQAIFQKMREEGITQEDRTALRESMTKNNDVMKAELGKLLTAAQAEKFKGMQGKPFTADEN